MNKNIKTPRYVINLARKMRAEMTPTEKILWNELKEKKVNGFKFRKQHPIFRYILDFYCHEKHLCIEVDGDIHKSRVDYDNYRDSYLQSLEIDTLRFSNNDIINSLAQVIEKIQEKLLSK